MSLYETFDFNPASYVTQAAEMRATAPALIDLRMWDRGSTSIYSLDIHSGFEAFLFTYASTVTLAREDLFTP
jgi:hypothetical protein